MHSKQSIDFPLNRTFQIKYLVWNDGRVSALLILAQPEKSRQLKIYFRLSAAVCVWYKGCYININCINNSITDLPSFNSYLCSLIMPIGRQGKNIVVEMAEDRKIKRINASNE